MTGRGGKARIRAAAKICGFALLVICACACRPGRSREDEASAGCRNPAGWLPNDRIAAEISSGEAHGYALEARAGDYFEVAVEQRGVDVATTLFDPRLDHVVTVDSALAYQGPEALLAVAATAGRHCLEVRAADRPDRPPGNYSLELRTLRAASADDRLRARGLIHLRSGVRLAGREGLAELERARELFEALEDDFWLAKTLRRLASRTASLGEASSLYHESAELFGKLGNQRMQAVALSGAAVRLYDHDDFEDAIDYHRRALGHRLAAGDRFGQASSYNDLGQAYRILGEIEKARDSYLEAMKLWDEKIDRFEKAQTDHDLGVLYRILGKTDPALSHLQSAHQVWSALSRLKTTNEKREDLQRNLAISFNELARLYHLLEEFEKALEFYRQALELRRPLPRVKDRRGEAKALANRALTRSASGSDAQARRDYLEALAILGDLREQRPRERAKVLLALGLLDASARPREALPNLREALELYREIADPRGRVESLRGMALAQASLGDLEGALRAATEAFELVEHVRLHAISQEIRSSFFATVQSIPELLIDLLMRSHFERREAGHDALAFQASERARARSLLELLVEAKAGVRGGVERNLLERERTLQEKLSQDALRLWRILDLEKPRQSQVDLLNRQLLETAAGLDQVQSEIRARSPRYAGLTQPRPLSLEAVQRLLPEDGTWLLEYHLGEQRSFLWRVDSDSLEPFSLPPRARIETRVREVYALLKEEGETRSRDLDATRALLCALSEDLLGPLAERLAGQRLVIVADEALHFLPFAALPHPADLDDCSGAPPLIVDHEIAYLPSASVLAQLREDSAARPPAARRVAVLADPVFSRADERLRVAAGAGRPRIADDELPRLRGTAAEAERIVEMAGPILGWSVVGFEASKKILLGEELKNYQIVHFATHGVLDAAAPEVYGLALSRFARDGHEYEDGGLLLTHELYNLDLPAEMVVLSACETALGKEVRGEGIVGLTRGFMYAGAPRVLVSLWKIGDVSSSALMAAFYRGLLGEGLGPAAALRRAQLAVREESPDPFHWATFVLQGDWMSLPDLRR